MLKLNHLTGFGSGAGAAAGGDVTSCVFDGTGDYLQVPDHADWVFGASSGFTIECWVYMPVVSGAIALYEQSNGSGTDAFAFYFESASRIRVRHKVAGSDTVVLQPSHGMSANTWHHIALTRNASNQFDIWVDGSSVGNDTDATSIPDFSSDVTIGTDGNTGYAGADFKGYIDDFRISDTARYTTSFTPSTTQFTSDANTVLLIHSGEAYTGALTGETDQAVYAFDGVNDYLTIPDHADLDFPNGGDFTLEFFMRTPDGTPATDMTLYDQIEGSDYIRLKMASTSGDFNYQIWQSSSTVVDILSNSGTISDNTWHHIALVRNNDNYFIFVDGVDQTASGSPDSSTPAAMTGTAYIGVKGDASADFTGQIAEYRISNTARYTSGFTPTTTRFTSDSNTKLLIHGDEFFTGNRLSGTTGSGATFTDSGNTGHTVTEVGNAISARGGTFNDSGNTTHVVTENGNAKRTTESEFKFADDGVGYFFDGTGDYLSAADHADWSLGSSNFTIDLWFRSNTASGSRMLIAHHDTTAGQMGWQILHKADAVQMAWSTNGTSITTDTFTNIQVPNKWYHLALVRSSTSLYCFIDGVQIGSTETMSGTLFNTTEGLLVGASGEGGSPQNFWNGYLDEIRISDTDRGWTGGFTPSSTQYASDANTLLLIHCGETKSGSTGSGATFTDSGDTGHTITENGNAIESTGNFYKF